VVKGRGCRVDVLAVMRPEDVVVCDLEDNKLDGPPSPPSASRSRCTLASPRLTSTSGGRARSAALHGADERPRLRALPPCAGRASSSVRGCVGGLVAGRSRSLCLVRGHTRGRVVLPSRRCTGGASSSPPGGGWPLRPGWPGPGRRLLLVLGGWRRRRVGGGSSPDRFGRHLPASTDGLWRAPVRSLSTEDADQLDSVVCRLPHHPWPYHLAARPVRAHRRPAGHGLPLLTPLSALALAADRAGSGLRHGHGDGGGTPRLAAAGRHRTRHAGRGGPQQPRSLSLHPGALPHLDPRLGDVDRQQLDRVSTFIPRP